MKSILTITERVARSRAAKAFVALLAADFLFSEPAWPSARGSFASAQAGVGRGAPPPRFGTEATSLDDALVKSQKFCVASSGRSFGALGSTVLYRYRRSGNELHVGYFVHWSTERPWGDNELTRFVFPALAIDAAYSHFLFVFPGVQRVLYGPADIEGALLRYRIEGERLVPEGALADDAWHDFVRLEPAEILAPDGRVTLLTEVWSHQLGARNATRRSSSAEVTCFQGAALVPLSTAVAEDFRLGSETAPLRARPAWRTSLD